MMTDAPPSVSTTAPEYMGVAVHLRNELMLLYLIT
jgi:hypothetical protein